MHPWLTCAHPNRQLSASYTLLFGILILLLGNAAYGETPEEAGTGELLFRAGKNGGYQPATHLSTRYEVQVSGLIASTTLTQRFRNDTQEWLEAVYVFPLPTDAAVHGMTLQVGERRIKGEIREREKARKAYTQAKQQGKKAALVEQQRPNLFTTEVANIPPGETVEVHLDYQQSVTYRDGTFELRLPTTLTPRYMPGRPLAEENPLQWQGGWARPTSEVPDADKISPYTVPREAVLQGSHNAKIQLTLNAGLPLAKVTSPSHSISPVWNGDTVEVTPTGGVIAMNRDAVFRWRPALGEAPRAAVFHEQWEGEDYVMLMLVPGLPQTQDSALPREQLFIIDTSGSMGGTSIRQAKAALQQALDTLTPRDRFNIIAFSDSPYTLFPAARQADTDALRQAQGFVGSLSAHGGTQMAPALARAFAQPDSNGWLQQIVFITDGAVGNEAALFRQIHEQLGDARLFTVGIGSAPNSHFMRKAAQFGRGTYTFVDGQDQVAGTIGGLIKKLRSPVLGDLQVAWPDPKATVLPQRPGDLYRAEPLVLVAKASSANGTVGLSGKISGGSGQTPWSSRLDLSRAAPAKGLHRLWARRRIGELIDQKALGEAPDAIRQAVLPIALRHQLASPYTSFVAIEDRASRPDDATLKKDSVPTLLPDGMTRRMVRMPSTATPSSLLVTLGLVAMAMGLALHGLHRETA
ncbi:marine proteobacterial sortase target protein [Marinobacteraceae bacterium S3BR75-40.1]